MTASLPSRSSSRSSAAFVLALAILTPATGCDDEGGDPPGPDGGFDAAVDASSSPDGRSDATADAMADASPADADKDASALPLGRLIVLGRDGHVASRALMTPFAELASMRLAGEVQSAKCHRSLCAVVHGAPVNTVDVIDAGTLAVKRAFALPSKADPRDATWLDEHTLLVTQYESASLLVFDTNSGAQTPIDLAALADSDGLPEAGHTGSCGHIAYVQLGRIEHESGAQAQPPMLAVIDWDRQGNKVVDTNPNQPGVQGIALADPADFDMPIDCTNKRLYVAEPKPLFSGGGRYQVVDLTTFTASEFAFTSGAQIGGFALVTPELGWRITHTEFGPGASSHLELVGTGQPFDTHNTFSGDHVDDLAYDPASDLLFFPDPCRVTPANQGCRPGVHVFNARTGTRATTNPLSVSFAPLEVAIARAP